jgi:hypothetical protein
MSSFLSHRRKAFRGGGGSPSTTNLLAYWGLSNLADSHTGGYDLTSTSVTFGDANTPPNPDAAQFDTGISLSATDAELPLTTGAQTFAAWVRSTNLTSNQDIMTCWDTVGDRAFLLRFVGSSNKLNFRISSTGSDNITIDSSTSLVVNTWTHVCAVFVPSTSITIYIDGVSDASNTTSIPASINDSSDDFVMGNRLVGGTSNFWSGQLDEACIFDKALSDDEVAWLADDHFYADL